MTSGSKRMAELLNNSPVEPDKKKRSLEKRLQTDVGELGAQTKAVTPQQWKFVQELIDGEGKQTLRQAALNAGYDEKKASKVASELTDPKINPQVVAAIQQYRKDMAEKYGTNIERHLRDLQHIRDEALSAGNFGAAVTAEYRRGQALGTIYVDRKEIRHGTIDSMSVDEVKRKLDEIKAMYGGPPPKEIIDVTPEQVQDQPEEPSIIEQFRDAEKTRIESLQEDKRESPDSDDNSSGESSGAGAAGLSDSDTEKEICDGGAESSEQGKESEAFSPSGRFQSETWNNGATRVDTGPIPPERDTEKV
jgi:hypothetical protein